MKTQPDARTRWLGLFAAASGIYLTALDITVNVALPDITANFGTDAVTIQWIIIFYVGASTAMQLGLGGAADAFGIVRMFLFGLIAYTVAVFVIGLADSLGLVFGLRVFQAVGNALLLALGPAIVTRLFPPDFRGRALGIMAALGTLGMITGSLGGGLLVDAFGWRAIFLARVPLCLAAIGFSAAFLRLNDSNRVNDDRAARFDLRGAFALFIGIASLIMLLSLGGRHGWTAFYIPILGVASLASLFVFAFIEKRAARPVLDLSLLRHRVLAPAILTSMLISVATFVNWFILPFFVIDELGASAGIWGVLLLLMTLTNAAASPVGGWLSDRAHPSYTITASLAVSTLAMLWLSALDSASSIGAVGIGLSAIGIGMGLFQSANANLIMGSVPADRLGMGGGIVGLSRGLGTVFSVALIGALFAARRTARDADTTSAADAFALAFRDTYLTAAALSVIAIILSLTLWPRLRLRRAKQPSRIDSEMR